MPPGGGASVDAVERASRRGELVDAALDRRVIDQRRRVVRLDPRVDDQRAGAAPVLLLDECADSLDVGGRIGAGERHPEEVSQASAPRIRCRRRSRSAGSRGSGRPISKERQNVSDVGSSLDNDGPGRPGCRAARRAGRGSRPAGADRRAARAGSVRRAGPAAAMTTFDPWLKPWPE